MSLLPRPVSSDRTALRQRLLGLRREFAASAEFESASRALLAHLSGVLAHLGPDCLGIYWPLRAEFNAATSLAADEKTADIPLALPFARKEPREMHFRRWDGAEPTLRDECDIPAAQGDLVVPDVLLVPCVGFSETGFRLGYGGGYYDRYLAAHPHVTAVGVAWEAGRLAADEFAPEPHDQGLMFVVTERGVVG
jgi:5-formyltetrahydrofolate cyclo-ligase